MRNLLIILLIVPLTAYADITLPWSTTWDCNEYNPGAINTWSPPEGCTDTVAGLWQDKVTDQFTQITSSANNSLGSGNGVRFWDGDGSNAYSAILALWFTSAQKELWIRWYIRYESGFRWSGETTYDKWIYLYTAGPSAQGGFELWGSDSFRFWSNGTSGVLVEPTGDGWTSMMGGTTSDGEFHCIEIHIKMDTDTTDGIGQLWVDGEEICNETNLNWSNGNATQQLGWIGFLFDHNQSHPDNSESSYVDWDDISISATGPIGEIDSSSSPAVSGNGVCGNGVSNNGGG